MCDITKIGMTKTLVHWAGRLPFQMERSTAVPLGRWLKAGEGECGTPIVGFWGGTEVAGVAVSSLRQTKQDKPC